MLFPAHIERVIRLKDVDALLETMDEPYTLRSPVYAPMRHLFRATVVDGDRVVDKIAVGLLLLSTTRKGQKLLHESAHYEINKIPNRCHRDRSIITIDHR
jgi:hypothetical protein